MAFYQYRKHLFVVKDPVFSRENEPGAIAALAGIYRCIGCGREVAVEMGMVLPDHQHHHHTEEQGQIRWKLIVYADPREK